MDETYEAVRDVIVEVMKCDPAVVKTDTRFVEDLNADSMDQFFLIDGFCEKFDLTIADDEARNIKTVADAVTYIDKFKK